LNSFQTSGNSPGALRLGSLARCRVGILGFGTGGSASARRLTGPDSPTSLQLTPICDRRAREKRARQPDLQPGGFRTARGRGGTIGQLAHAEDQRERATLVAGVAPTFVPGHSVFAPAVGPQNAAVMTGAHADITLAPVLRAPALIRGLNDRKLAEAV
jgi:hypothetical protein